MIYPNAKKFDVHVECACAKGRSSLMKISTIFLGRSGLSVSVGAQVYKALMRSLFEYAVSAWLFRGIRFIDSFHSLQYQCLRY
jgi:hypothetical protein